MFGPSKEAARIEASKVFAKELMRHADVPTAEFSVFDHPQPARDYIGTRKELLEGADTLFAAVISGKLHVPINHAYALKDAGKAHIDLESRTTTGASILKP